MALVNDVDFCGEGTNRFKGSGGWKVSRHTVVCRAAQETWGARKPDKCVLVYRSKKKEKKNTKKIRRNLKALI